jgi:hypothetical protein
MACRQRRAKPAPSPWQGRRKNNDNFHLPIESHEKPQIGATGESLIHKCPSAVPSVNARGCAPHAQHPAPHGKGYGTASSTPAASGTVGRRQASGPGLGRRLPRAPEQMFPEPPAGHVCSGRKVQRQRPSGSRIRMVFFR